MACSRASAPARRRGRFAVVCLRRLALPWHARPTDLIIDRLTALSRNTLNHHARTQEAHDAGNPRRHTDGLTAPPSQHAQATAASRKKQEAAASSSLSAPPHAPPTMTATAPAPASPPPAPRLGQPRNANDDAVRTTDVPGRGFVGVYVRDARWAGLAWPWWWWEGRSRPQHTRPRTSRNARPFGRPHHMFTHHNQQQNRRSAPW